MRDEHRGTVDPEVVRALTEPSAYPHPVDKVTMLQTHISHLFFAGDFVYKVKKPVDAGFLDFTSLEKRRYFCEKEVELNRRLSPEVYLGVSTIGRSEGWLMVDGPGKPIEYAVKMQRMPHDRSVAATAGAGKLTHEHIGAIARALADFHASAERPALSGQEALSIAEHNLQENVRQTAAHVGHSVSPERYDDLEAFCSAFLTVRGGDIARRADEGQYREGHGDLHAANVFLHDGVKIIDCIEFNRRFRVLDVADEIAFLSMDLDRLGRQDLSEQIEADYSQASGDRLDAAPMEYYRTYRAWVRGKVTATLAESGLDYADWVEASGLARCYFDLAHRYAMDAVKARPRLIAMAGLIGSGKSTLGKELARRWGIAYVSSDVTRKELAGLSPTDGRIAPFGEGIYTADFTGRTYGAVLSQVEKLLKRGSSVVVDASFARARHRALIARVAEAAGADAWLLESVSPLEDTRRRLGDRAAKPESTPSDGRWDTYLSQRSEWEPVGEAEPAKHAVIDSASGRHETVKNALEALFSWAVEAGSS